MTPAGFKDAATDESAISAWWKKWPEANIGLVTGAISGLVVIDIDRPEARDTLKELTPSFDLTAGPRSRTGNGWHLFFAHPGTPTQNRTKILPGVDVRADGGYIVAPPSRHISGKLYSWEIPISGNLPTLPPALLKLISSPTGNPSENGLRERFDTARALAGVAEGQRDETCFKFAYTLRSANVPREWAERLVLEAAKNCEPSFPDRLALEKVARAYQGYETKQSGAEKKERAPLTVKLSDVQREEVTWLWHNRIPVGKLTIIEGDPGEGKSFLSLAIATAVTIGRGLPGDAEQREPANVIMMSAEDGLGDTIRPRVEDMGGDLDRVIALRGLTDEQGRERPLSLIDLDVIEKAIIEHRPALVIVDPIIAYVAGRDTHKANEVRGLLAPLAALAEKHKTAILAIRHLNKSTAKAAYRGQGSINFLAA